MQETRQNRIARLLQKELATIFQGQTRQTHGVLISVTRVRISPDLSICTAYLSIFPSEKAEELLKNINANEKTIRYDLGRRVHNQLRIIPELRFHLDDSLDYIEHIDELLGKTVLRTNQRNKKRRRGTDALYPARYIVKRKQDPGSVEGTGKEVV